MRSFGLSVHEKNLLRLFFMKARSKDCVFWMMIEKIWDREMFVFRE